MCLPIGMQPCLQNVLICPTPTAASKSQSPEPITAPGYWRHLKGLRGLIGSNFYTIRPGPRVPNSGRVGRKQVVCSQCKGSCYFPFATLSVPCFAALIAAHLFFCAAAMCFRPAALIVRLSFLGAGLAGCGAEACLIFAHLAFCAMAIFRLAAALRFFRGFLISDGDTGSDPPSDNWRRISAILLSTPTFCASNPIKAAARMSGVSFIIGILIDFRLASSGFVTAGIRAVHFATYHGCDVGLIASDNVT